MFGIAITGFGAGMELNKVLQAGAQGLIYTIIGIFLTMVAGIQLGKWLKVNQEASLLISVGTAICGGSAIAALTATLNAKNENTSIALVTVLLLNTFALLTFPMIGHALDLNHAQFGLWSALAIHDTSSVVGAALQYGSESLAIATPVKLARALWIIPVSLVIKYFYSDKKHTGDTKAKIPWFIPGFLLSATVVTVFPVLAETGRTVAFLSQKLLIVALFFIGANLTKASLKNIGVKPFIQGVILWVAVSVITLLAIRTGFIEWKI